MSQIKCLLSKHSLRRWKYKYEFPSSPFSCHYCADIWRLFEGGYRHQCLYCFLVATGHPEHIYTLP